MATVIGFLGSAFGTVGGVGGGGIFVPMLTLIVGFDTKSAAALSKCKSSLFDLFISLSAIQKPDFLPQILNQNLNLISVHLFIFNQINNAY